MGRVVSLMPRVRARIESHEHLQELISSAAAHSGDIDKALNACEDMECPYCSVILCPWSDPFHFHHDGCPSCG